GVGERTSVADGNVCATEHPLRRKRAAAPSTQALLPRRFGPVRECRFHPLQIGVYVGRRCRALNVFCLRDLGINTRRYLSWIFNPPRRSFKLRVLVDRQRPMKNVTLDRTTVLQLYTHRTDGALNAAADCDILGNHAAIDRCAIADEEIGSAQLAFNSAEDLSRTITFDLPDGQHVGADARVRSRFRRRWLRP